MAENKTMFIGVGSVYKGKKWRVLCYYTDWRGQRVRHEKRGFETTVCAPLSFRTEGYG